MNKNLSSAIEKAGEKISPKDNFPANQGKFDKKQLDYGWGITTKKFNLTTIKVLNLPTYWTMDQPFVKPYIFTKQS